MRRQFIPVNMHTVEFLLPSDAIDDSPGDHIRDSIEYLGGGSFGNAIKIKSYLCPDGHRKTVAIKKLYEPFRNKKTALRAYREIKLLQLLVHENVVKLLDLYTPDTSPSTLYRVFIVTEYGGKTLYEILKLQREEGRVLLTPDHHVFIIYQLLRALKYIHSANVIHRDLKPSNLAITSDCDLVVLDFGLARTLNTETAGLSTYVMTRWYRSPEVIYWKIDSYDTQADMWSVGCILAELSLGRPLFPGENNMAQYRLIAELCGSPDDDLKAKLSSDEAVYKVILNLGTYPRKCFADVFSNCSPKLVDFLDRILVLDPEKRMTVTEALAHPYVADYSMPDDEPTVTEPFSIDDCEQSRSLEEWKELVFNEIVNFRQFTDHL
ncbi:hypothetical protein AB6A40_002563 [Gnathostoma spinigerum]|uniref:Protein kinase domain-containing protein n=1 Tax=Gnathostoma spinigerum TaxID=75299 RepID=A0ABD6E6X4_9BILA